MSSEPGQGDSLSRLTERFIEIAIAAHADSLDMKRTLEELERVVARHTEAILSATAATTARTELWRELAQGLVAAAMARWPWLAIGVAVGVGALKLQEIVRLLLPPLPVGGVP